MSRTSFCFYLLQAQVSLCVALGCFIIPFSLVVVDLFQVFVQVTFLVLEESDLVDALLRFYFFAFLVALLNRFDFRLKFDHFVLLLGALGL